MEGVGLGTGYFLLRAQLRLSEDFFRVYSQHPGGYGPLSVPLTISNGTLG